MLMKIGLFQAMCVSVLIMLILVTMLSDYKTPVISLSDGGTRTHVNNSTTKNEFTKYIIIGFLYYFISLYKKKYLQIKLFDTYIIYTINYAHCVLHKML